MIYLELFWTFLKIGAFTFGGGYAMLPLIQAEVLSHGWVESAARSAPRWAWCCRPSSAF